MKIYLVKELDVKTFRHGAEIREYKSASADYIFTSKKKAQWFFNKLTEKGEWIERKSTTGIIRRKKDPFFNQLEFKVFTAYEINTKETINF